MDELTYLKYKSDLLEADSYWSAMLFPHMTNINRKTLPKMMETGPIWQSQVEQN